MADALPTLRPVDFDPFAAAATTAVVLPLTEPQREMWAAAAMSSEASCSYNQCFALTLSGPLRVESLRNALDEVIVRHEALRSVIASDGTTLEILPTLSLAVPLVDLSGLDPADREREIEALLTTECDTPFDLANGPLIRAVVVRETADRHTFVLTVHHIVCDGWSSSVLFTDLGQFYIADCVGIPTRLTPAGSFRGYVADQASADRLESAAADEEYWAAQYEDGAPVLDLPLAGARPPLKTYRSGREHRLIDETLYADLRGAGAKSGATLFVWLLTAFDVLVYRLSGQSDFVVGIPLAQQPQLANPALVAHCVNTVPLRTRLDPAASFADNVRAVRHALTEAHEHSELTFGSLVRRLKSPRDRGRTPLVPITFTLDRIGAPFDFGDVTIDAVATPKSYSNFELSINLVDSGADIVVECAYNEDLFDGPTIRNWLAHYETLLRATVQQPDTDLDALPMLGDEARTTMLVDWNDTSVSFPDDKRLDRLFEAQAHRTPDADAVISGTERMSYRELDRRANHLAHRLRALGVRNESLVGVCLERSFDLVLTLLAVLKAGGAYLPLDPEYPPARLAFMVEDSQAMLTVTRRELAARLPGDTQLLCVDEENEALSDEATTGPEADGSPDSLAYVIYTSGSTGRPNGVEIQHAAVANYLLWVQSEFRLDASDRVLQRTSISFDASAREVWAPLLAGACLVLAPPDPRQAVVELAEVVRDHGVTVLALVPSLARVFLDDVLAADCTSLRLVTCGGEPLPADLYRELRERLDVRVLNLYGPTEATVNATWWPSTEEVDDDDLTARIRARGWMPIGRPVANARAYVLDDRREPVPVGTVGELYVAGACLARGYRFRDELTAERFVHVSFGDGVAERAYRTGDLARYRHDGTLEFMGRVDHQVKIRGFRIELGEIEALLAAQEEVADVVVVAREDSTGDSRLVAYVVARGGDADLAGALKARAREVLPEYMVPSHIVSLETLPLSPSGKVDRKSLPAPTPETAPAARKPAPPTTTTEVAIADLWADALDTASPGVHDDFFDLGGHSLIAARIVSALRAAFGVDVTMRHLFEQPTIAGLAKTVDLLAVSGGVELRAAGGEREQVEV